MMPELPEVETVRRTLNELITGKQIEHVTVRLPRIIQRPDDIQVFAHMLAGHTVVTVERRGKFLRFVFDGLVMVSHLRMEGRYGVYREGEPAGQAYACYFPFHRWDGACVIRMCASSGRCIYSSRERICA